MKKYRLYTAVCCAVMVLCSCSSVYKRSAAGDYVRMPVNYTAWQSEGELLPDNTDGKILAAKNKYLELYYSADTFTVSVFDRRTGAWWHSNPDEEGLSAAAASQLSMDTISSQGVVAHYTSYTDSLSRKQVSAQAENEKLTVTYVFGNMAPDLSAVPLILTGTRYLALLERMEQSGKSLMARRYSYSKDTDIWTRKPGLTKDMADNLCKLFESIGYSAAELAEDNSLTGAKEEDDGESGFEIPLCYMLQDDSLLVSIDNESVRFSKNEIITSMSVLEYFGALSGGEDGELFVPDGSGALIDTTPAKGSAGAYAAAVFGPDRTVGADSSGGTKQYDILLPVFGVRRGSNTMLAIIEDNETSASVMAAKAGYLDGYARVNAAFTINTAENVGLTGDSISKFFVTSAGRYTGDTVIRYIFLSDDEESAGYSGMAGIYREYLRRYGGLEDRKPQGDIPFFMETVGAGHTRTSTLGIVYDTDTAFTTYDQNIIMAKELSDKGVSDIRLILTGWMQGGRDQQLAGRASPLKVLGGTGGFKRLCDFMKNAEGGMYPQVLFNTMSDMDSLSLKNTYASRTLGKKRSTLAVYDQVTGSMKSQAGRPIVSPSLQKGLAEDWNASMVKLWTGGASVGDLAQTSYSDYRDGNEFLRPYSLMQSAEIIRTMSGSFDKLVLTSPNVLNAVNAELFTDVPASSSSYSIFSKSVPFYQMVVHGAADYAHSSLNYTAELRRSLLRCAEYGACPKFTFVYGIDSGISFNESYGLYAAQYSQWSDTAVECYSFLNPLLTPVRGAAMTGHAELSDGVYRTMYDNGYAIYVNYTDMPVITDGISINEADAVVRFIGND